MSAWSRHPVAVPVGAAVIAMVSIQSGAALAKGLFPLVGAQGATALRLSFASLMMLAIWRPWRARVAAHRRLSILAYGVVLGLMNLLFYLALSRIPLGIAVALEFTGPLGLALVTSRRGSDFLWVALAIAGIYLLLPLRALHAPLDPLGILLALAAGVFWALYIICGRRAGAEGSGPAVAYGSLIGSLVVAPFGLAQAGAALFSHAVIPIAITVALLSSAIPYSLEMIAMTRLPARVFGILMSVEPAIGALAGLAFLQETLTLMQMAAIGLIMLASAGVVLTHGAIEPAPV